MKYTAEQKAVLTEMHGPGLIFHHNGAVTKPDGEIVIRSRSAVTMQKALQAIIDFKNL